MILALVLKILAIALILFVFAFMLVGLALIASLAGRKPTPRGDDRADDGTTRREKDLPLRAIVLCDTTIPVLPQTFDSEGYSDCAHAARTFGGTTLCPKACLGLGSCSIVCPAGAISIEKGRIRITDACSGCGKCVPVCPRDLLRLVPLAKRESTRCAGSGIPQTAEFCATAKNGHIIDYHDFPESFFKNLDTWGILRKKSRFE